MDKVWLTARGVDTRELLQLQHPGKRNDFGCVTPVPQGGQVLLCPGLAVPVSRELGQSPGRLEALGRAGEQWCETPSPMY